MAVAPPTQISVQIIKTMPYRGNTVRWSNTWYFNTAVLPSVGDRNAIVATITAQEQIQYSSRVQIVEAIWRGAGSAVPVSSQTLSLTGSMATTGRSSTPGDCAIVARFSTTQRTSKNHPIYLFKYFHDVYYDTGSDVDTVAALQIGRVSALASMMVAGISQGGITYKYCGPYGAVAQGQLSEPLITHRDFPR